jgi:hypothetical protein
MARDEHHPAMTERDRQRREDAKRRRREARKQMERTVGTARTQGSIWASDAVKAWLDAGWQSTVLERAAQTIPFGVGKAAVAHEFLRAMMRWDAFPNIATEEAWRVGSALAYLAGLEHARAAVAKAALKAGEAAETLYWVANSLEPLVEDAATDSILTAELVLFPPAHVREVLLASSPGARRFLGGIKLILATTNETKCGLAATLLEQFPGADDRRAFAAIGVLTPTLGRSVRAMMIEALAREAHPAGLAFLAAVDAEVLGLGLQTLARRALMRAGWAPMAAPVEAINGVPLWWPIEHATALPSFGSGYQGVFLVRRQAPQRFAFFGVVTHEIRGAVEGLAALDLDSAALARIMADAGASRADALPMAPARAVQLILQAIKRTEQLGHPLPFEVAHNQYLLGGIPAPESCTT